MALSYPLDMPGPGIAGQEFELLRIDYAAPEGSGRIGGISAATPKWAPVWTLSKTMTRDMSDEWRAWVAALRGSQRMFEGYDRDRHFPRSYPNGFGGMTRAGGGDFEGPTTAWSQTIQANGDADLSLEGLPAGFIFKQGDYVGFYWVNGAGAERTTMVRALTAGIANGSGEVTLTVEPPVDMRVVPETALAYLNGPKALMKLIPEKTQLGPMDRLARISGGTIAAMQVLLP